MADASSDTDSPDAPRRSPWLVSCAHCGAPVQKRTRMARRYCSDDCYAARKRILRKQEVKPPCELCGNEFTRTSARQRFCVSCKPEARRKYTREYNATNEAAVLETRRQYMAARFKRNPEHVREIGRQSRVRRRDETSKKRRTPEYRKIAAARAREKNKQPTARLDNRISSAIYQAIASQKAGRGWETLVGYTLADLVRHIERQFLKGMSWDNMGEWHIDHIVAKKHFKYERAEDDGFKACWAITNLRPLWAPDNQRKSARREFLL